MMEFLNTDNLKTDEIVLKLDHTCEANPEKQWVPAYYFNICLPDGTAIGYCDLRIGHNAKLYVGGNIGYGKTSLTAVTDTPPRLASFFSGLPSAMDWTM